MVHMFVPIMFKDNARSLQCGFVPDVGYMAPVTYAHSNLVIEPYMDMSKAIQEKAADLISHAFRVRVGDDPTRYIRENFSSSTDVLYVMSTHDGSNVYGAVSVDRKNFFPTIGHLVVSQTQRNKGYGSLLLDLAECFTAKQGFSEATLWCQKDDAHLHRFYRNRGYIEKEQDQDDAITMFTKQLHLQPTELDSGEFGSSTLFAAPF